MPCTHLYNSSHAGGVSVEFHRFDADYVRLLANGDPATEAHFSSYFGKFILLKLRSRRVTADMIEEVSQETMLRVLRTLRRGEGVTHPERFGAYVNSVAKNVLLELNHKNSKHPQLADDAPEPFDDRVDLDAGVVSEERKRLVAAILRELPAKDRKVLLLIFFEEMDREAICQLMKIDADYLRVLLHRAKAKFQTAYKKGQDKARGAANAIFLLILSNAVPLGITILMRWS